MKGQAFPCGKCLPCLFNRRRIWTHRLILELTQHGDATFATLTYDDKNLPHTSGGLPTLAPEHARNFLKRLRKAVQPTKLRFYLAGEYGDASWRPHYHIALFSYPTCLRGRTLRPFNKPFGEPLWRECCHQCRVLGNAWGHGNVDLGNLETSSAQYLCGYVTKKMTQRHDVRLQGREPEFARMSNRPGIGYDALHELASELMRLNLDTSQGDVPVTLRHGSRLLPLGRYLRVKLRKLIGKDEKTPDEILALLKEELRPVQETAFTASRSFASEIQKDRHQAALNFAAKQSLKPKRNL